MFGLYVMEVGLDEAWSRRNDTEILCLGCPMKLAGPEIVLMASAVNVREKMESDLIDEKASWDQMETATFLVR